MIGYIDLSKENSDKIKAGVANCKIAITDTQAKLLFDEAYDYFWINFADSFKQLSVTEAADMSVAQAIKTACSRGTMPTKTQEDEIAKQKQIQNLKNISYLLIGTSALGATAYFVYKVKSKKKKSTRKKK